MFFLRVYNKDDVDGVVCIVMLGLILFVDNFGIIYLN